MIQNKSIKVKHIKIELEATKKAAQCDEIFPSLFSPKTSILLTIYSSRIHLMNDILLQYPLQQQHMQNWLLQEVQHTRHLLVRNYMVVLVLVSTFDL